MPATLEEVRNIIAESFPGANVDQVLETNHRIGGVIFWDDFRDKDITERNRLVSERVRKKLGLRGTNVGILFPLASEEEL